QIRRIDAAYDFRADGTEGVEGLGAGPLSVLLLQIPRRHVVGAAEPGERFPAVFLAPTLDLLSDDESELSFVVDTRRVGRQHDIPAAANERGRGFQEQERLLIGSFVAELFGVFSVIAPDRDDLGRDDIGNLHGLAASGPNSPE